MTESEMKVLYDIALLIGSETKEKPLIQKLLQRLLYHSGMCSGLYLQGCSTTNGHSSFTIQQAITPSSFLLDQEHFYLVQESLPEAYALNHLQQLSGQIDPALAHYHHVLFLPINSHEGFLLLAEQEQALSLSPQLLEPLLANLANTLELCRCASRLETASIENSESNRSESTTADIISPEVKNQILAQANQAKCEFLRGMSHELRTPLNAIQGYAQLLEMDQEHLSDEHNDQVQEIRSASHHLAHLIDEVADLARIESGQVELDLEALHCKDLLDEVKNLAAPLQQQWQITLEMTLPELSSPPLYADKKRTRQILLNLLSNGIKYNRPDGRVVIDVEFLDEAAHIHIRDTGFGLTEEQQTQLFEPFKRFGRESSQQQGKGIGLTICKKLAEAMEGQITVNSIVGEGSQFTLTLPICQGVQRVNSIEGQKLANAENTDGLMHTTTLYVEDNMANRLLVEKIFSKRQGDRLLTASTPEEGLTLLRTESLDLVILDINLPGMSGFELLQLMRAEALHQEKAVIALSANAMPSDIELGLSSGFDAYLTKPLNIPEFTQKLDHWLNRD